MKSKADDVSDSADKTAADWAVRYPLDAEQIRALEAWLAQDPRHAGALLRARAALSQVDAALAHDHWGAAGRVAPSRRWMVAGLGGAIAAAFAGFFARSAFSGNEITTTQGEIRRLPLADGSVATIDTDSELHISLARSARRISLRQGQAWFQVAKDRSRPFIVDAGVAQARAVGTAFSVRRAQDGVQIAVTEGVVAAWAANGEGSMTILKAGEIATFRNADAAAETRVAPDAIERSLAWRDGEIALQNDTLASAVAQFNRYNRVQMVVADDGLGEERLVGLFRLDDPDGFTRTLMATLDIVVVRNATEIRIVRKKITAV